MPLDVTQVSVDVAIEQIVVAGRLRRFCIKGQSRCDRSIDSLIAGQLGFSTDLKENQRKALFRQAADIRKAVEKGGEGQFVADAPDALSAIYPLIRLSAQSRKVWDDQRKAAETMMEEMAAILPLADWARSIRGFGLFNLALVVSEAGRSPSAYRSVSALWKRLGLAVISGERQQRKSGEAGIEHGFSPRRRAEIYVVGSVSVFMAQKPGMPYRDVYDARRAHTAPRIEATADLKKGDPAKWTLGRCDNDARRVMTKALIRDLWVEWRKACPS